MFNSNDGIVADCKFVQNLNVTDAMLNFYIDDNHRIIRGTKECRNFFGLAKFRDSVFQVEYGSAT